MCTCTGFSVSDFSNHRRRNSEFPRVTSKREMLFRRPSGPLQAGMPPRVDPTGVDVGTYVTRMTQPRWDTFPCGDDLLAQFFIIQCELTDQRRKMGQPNGIGEHLA